MIISIQFLRFTPEIAGLSSTKELTMSGSLQLGTLAVVAVVSLCSPAGASYSYDGWAHARLLGHASYWSQSCAGLTLGGSSTITGR